MVAAWNVGGKLLVCVVGHGSAAGWVAGQLVTSLQIMTQRDKSLETGRKSCFVPDTSSNVPSVRAPDSGK
jgi:hypothetical protein